MQYLANTGSLLPQTEEDLSLIKKVSMKEPERIVNRMEFLMTELNFLLEVV